MPIDTDEQFICEHEAELCEYVRREAERRAVGDDVAKASWLLYQRIGHASQSLYVLRDHAPHDWSVDGVSILRTIYDATLQLLWLLHDPKRRAERAKLYLDFLEVEKHQMLHRFDWLIMTSSEE